MLGALGVFALGMVGIAVTRRVIAALKHVTDSSDPITIPLAFVPFTLDGDRLGTFDQAVLIRKSPHEVSALELHVKLADSSGIARVEGCGFAARFLPVHRDSSVQFSDADFSCVRGDSGGAPGTEPFGTIAFEPGGVRRPLYVPADVAQRLRANMRGGRPDAAADSIAEAADRQADSIGESASRLSDSLAGVHERRADSIRRAAHHTADSIRARAHRLRDSIRASVSRP